MRVILKVLVLVLFKKKPPNNASPLFSQGLTVCHRQSPNHQASETRCNSRRPPRLWMGCPLLPRPGIRALEFPGSGRRHHRLLLLLQPQWTVIQHLTKQVSLVYPNDLLIWTKRSLRMTTPPHCGGRVPHIGKNPDLVQGTIIETHKWQFVYPKDYDVISYQISRKIIKTVGKLSKQSKLQSFELKMS